MTLYEYGIITIVIQTNSIINMSQAAPSSQVYFITGCSSGFGAHMAEYFLSVGHKVVVTARDVSKVQSYVSKCGHERALAVALDVNQATSIDTAVKQTLDKFGRIDVLINNAGFGIINAFENFTEQEVRSIMETNFFGALFVTQRILPIMRQQKSGTIVQIGSTMGQAVMSSASIYCASKFALEGFSETLAQEVAPLGIRVIIAEPGPFATSFQDKAMSPSVENDEHYPSVAMAKKFSKLMHGNEPGDPRKFVEALARVINSDKPPVRIPFGPAALRMIEAHMAQQKADLDKWRDLIVSTDYDPMPEGAAAVMRQFAAATQQQV